MRPSLSLRATLALGVVQGPTELLPVSSSAHLALLTRFAGGTDGTLDAELRDALEMALHGGAAAALLLVGRAELSRTARELDGRRLVVGLLAVLPPALAGHLLEGRPAARPSGLPAIAGGLALGGVAMALADLRPQDRTLVQAGPRDGLALGVAQALALAPGVSRNGATLAMARARGFAREDAQTLSWRVGLPVIAGAAALRARRLAAGGTPPGSARTLAAGAGAAFLSTLAGAPLLRPGRRGRSLLPFALYRLALAAAVVRGSRRGGSVREVQSRLSGAHNRSR